VANLPGKTTGIADVLHDALAPMAGAVDLAFVYGSMAAGTEHAGSDIDLMILGDAGFAEVVHALVPAMASSPPLPTVRAI
jgi:predicted nucleotidyltransferase